MFKAAKGRFVFAVLFGTLLAVAAGAAIVPLSPAEGATVRETVRVAVAGTDVPEGGFVVFNVDGEFRVAVGVPKDVSGGKKAYVFDWDTKLSTVSPGQTGEPTQVADGRHEIEVAVHDSTGALRDSGTVSVRVANKIPTTTPPSPTRLAYKFFIGQQLQYDVIAKVELLDIEGRPMLDDPVILTSASQVTVSVEDMMPGSALVRYKWQPMVSIQYLGQPYPEAVYVPTPAYRYVSTGGKVTEAGFGGRSKAQLFDLFVETPGGPARPGDSWTASDVLNVPGVLRGAKVDLKSLFDSLEWESGHECAKIRTTLSSRFGLTIIKDRLELPESDMAGTGTAFFAYKTGKLMSVEYVLAAQTNVDSTILDSLRSGQGGDIGNLVLPGAGGGPFEGSPEGGGYRGEAPGPTYPGQTSGPPGGYYGPNAARAQTPVAETPVKFRITVKVELKK